VLLDTRSPRDVDDRRLGQPVLAEARKGSLDDDFSRVDRDCLGGHGTIPLDAVSCPARRVVGESALNA
jgi:hypothetical protein